MATKDPQIHPAALELAALLRPSWPEISGRLRASGVPVAEGDPAVVDPPADDPPADDPPEDDQIKPEDDWQAKARKHEREAKRLRKEKERLEAEARERENANKSDRERELETAREEARREALSESDKDRRQDRLEVASTRLAAKGFQVGEGDSAQTVRFADPDDALIYVERAIRAGDVDEADIFDDEGKVQADALQTTLAGILDSKPHLRASDGGKPNGDPDTRRGHAVDKDLEAMTPEDHAKRKYGTTK